MSFMFTSCLPKTDVQKKKKNMKRRFFVLLVVVMVAAFAVIPASANRGNGKLKTVFVTSQGLYYDTFIPVDYLPAKGPFQKLEVGVVPTDLQTEFGPSDSGYLGGGWWVDANGDGVMNEGDAFFLCPLLGPGRETP